MGTENECEELVCVSLTFLTSPFLPPPLSSPDVYDLLKENLMTRDDAVIGEAAGLAMGLVMIGTRSPTAIEDMLNVRAPAC